MLRLQTRSEFQAVLANHTIARTAHFAMHRTEINEDTRVLPKPRDVSLGAMVPKRWAKRAVTRNLIKRQIYGLGHGFATQLLKADHVVRLRATFDRAHFKSASSEQLKTAVRLELEQLFRKVIVSLPEGAM